MTVAGAQADGRWYKEIAYRPTTLADAAHNSVWATVKDLGTRDSTSKSVDATFCHHEQQCCFLLFVILFSFLLSLFIFFFFFFLTEFSCSFLRKKSFSVICLVYLQHRYFIYLLLFVVAVCLLSNLRHVLPHRYFICYDTYYYYYLLVLVF